MSEVDLGWADVLRRARRPRRRSALAAAVAAVVVAGGSTLGVVLTQNAGAVRLPLSKIGGTQIVTVLDPHTRRTIFVVGRWRKHDGVCFLVPRVRAGCLGRGRMLLLPFRRPGWRVVVRRAASVELLDAKGRVLERITLNR
jgi:hypothetical protein